MIVCYFTDKLGHKIFESIEYFSLSRKELEKKYKIECTDFSTKYDEKWKDEAKDIIKKLEKKKISNFEQILSSCESFYSDSDDFENLEKMGELLHKYKKNSKNLSMNELEKQYFSNDEYKVYMDYFWKKTLLLKGYNINHPEYGDKYKLIQKKYLFPNILKIDLENIENCVYLLYIKTVENKIKKDYFYNYDDEYNALLNQKENYSKETENDLLEDIKNIIEDDKFVNDFLEILNSKSVSDYFERRRRFLGDENNFNIEFLSNYDIELDDDDLLRNEFLRLKEFFKKDKNFLKNLIVYKYLPKSIRAFVDPRMRIVINPLFFEFTTDLSYIKKKEILKSYIYIILIHEIVHLLKYLKNDQISFDNIPATPKGKEGGKVFINYLFNLPVIYYITYEQAKIINNINNWSNIEKLKKIFISQKKWYEEKKINKKENGEKPPIEDKESISFYLSVFDEDDNISNNEEMGDEWYDIN